MLSIGPTVEAGRESARTRLSFAVAGDIADVAVMQRSVAPIKLAAGAPVSDRQPVRKRAHVDLQHTTRVHIEPTELI